MATRRVIKTHLKQEEGVKQLMKRSIENIRKRMSFVKVETQEPPELQSILNPIRQKMETLKREVKSGETNIKAVLEQMDEDKLRALKRIFAPKDKNNSASSTKTITEEKLIQTCPIVLEEDMAKLDLYLEHINLAKDTILTTYTECFALTYNQCHGTSVNFNNEKFIGEVDSAMTFRQALRRVANSQNGNDNGFEEVINEGSNGARRCIIC